jgi:hypothetical protein
MKTKSLLFTLPFAALSFFSNADVAEFKGKVTDILVGKSETIKVGLLVPENQPITCTNNADSDWLMTFERGHSYSDDWFDVLNLVRRTQETIRIGYVENSSEECAIEYLALLKGDGNDIDDGKVGDSLERRGTFGTISQIYTNNLTESNYSASGYYSADVAAAAFDGHIFGAQIVAEEGELIGRGIWLIQKEKVVPTDGYWLQVEFDEPVSVSGFRVLINTKSAELGRGPKGVTILTSVDGETFDEQGKYSLSKTIDQRADLSEKVEAKIFRIKVTSNYGDKYIEIDELEIFSK